MAAVACPPVDQNASRREPSPLRLVVPLDPSSAAALAELQVLHGLLTAMGRVTGGGSPTRDGRDPTAETWQDDDYTYFDLALPVGQVGELDVSVANDRLFIRVARDLSLA